MEKDTPPAGPSHMAIQTTPYIWDNETQSWTRFNNPLKDATFWFRPVIEEKSLFLAVVLDYVMKGKTEWIALAGFNWDTSVQKVTEFHLVENSSGEKTKPEIYFKLISKPKMRRYEPNIQRFSLSGGKSLHKLHNYYLLAKDLEDEILKAMEIAGDTGFWFKVVGDYPIDRDHPVLASLRAHGDHFTQVPISSVPGFGNNSPKPIRITKEPKPGLKRLSQGEFIVPIPGIDMTKSESGRRGLKPGEGFTVLTEPDHPAPLLAPSANKGEDVKPSMPKNGNTESVATIEGNSAADAPVEGFKTLTIDAEKIDPAVLYASGPNPQLNPTYVGDYLRGKVDITVSSDPKLGEAYSFKAKALDEKSLEELKRDAKSIQQELSLLAQKRAIEMAIAKKEGQASQRLP